MGVSSSKLEDDKALQLCRERKKYVRQALDGRCSLAAAHVAYIDSLKSTGIALRKFVQPEGPVESSLYTSTSATPEPLALTDKSVSQFSFSSPSVARQVNGTEHLSPSPSPPMSSQYQVHHMKFRGSSTRKVEEKPLTAVTGTITSLSVTQNPPPHSEEKAEPRPSETPAPEPETGPWDYFGLSHPFDNHFTSHEERDVGHDFDHDDYVNRVREAEEMPGFEDLEEKVSSHGSEGYEESDDEFDDPSSETLVRRFENLNRGTGDGASDASQVTPTAGGNVSENDLSNGEKVSSPRLSPLRAKSSEPATVTDAKMTPMKEDDIEHKIAPKDFFSSIRDVEYLFLKASDSGKEVPRMLDANKLHFRPMEPGTEPEESVISNLLKACFSCGEDPNQVQEEPVQSRAQYLTWHRTTSTRSSSSMYPLGSSSRDDIEDLSDLFANFSMISASHASTLDRLYAWERKLYDEVKASRVVRMDYDMKCKLLRDLESRDASKQKIDKTRAVVKDLRSRILVAIHRIDSISRRIEELRDGELQPQLEELIEGLRRMWEVMYECHKLQVHIITIASTSQSNLDKFSLRSESRRQITIELEYELSNLSSTFTKWTTAFTSFLQAIKTWLHKCVIIPQKSSRRKRRVQPPDLEKYGPPIYTTCKEWLDLLKKLPTKETTDTIKGLAAETSQFLPRQEKGQGKKGNEGDEPGLEMLKPESLEDLNSCYDRFRASLVIFLSQLSSFAEGSVKMYGELRIKIQEAKVQYEHLMSQP